MLALPCRTVDHGNAVCLGITANATAEPAGQPHKVGVFERLVRSGQRPPPHPDAYAHGLGLGRVEDPRSLVGVILSADPASTGANAAGIWQARSARRWPDVFKTVSIGWNI